MIYRHLASGGGDFGILSTSLIAILVIALSSVLVACDKDDEPVRTDDPTTRAMTREDSIAAGLIIQLGVENGGEWDGETNYEF